MKPFAESDFVVAWTGEVVTSAVVRTWAEVVKHVQGSMGIGDDEMPDFLKCLDDPDMWINADAYKSDDTRMLFGCTDFVYLSTLTIVRIIDDRTVSEEV